MFAFCGVNVASQALYNEFLMLIIALPLSPANELTYVVSLDGQGVQSSGQSAPERLPRVGGEVVAVVPWQRLSWHQVTLPPVSAQRRLAVLQGLLEDQVLQDVESLHWVTSPTLTQGETSVLACDKAWLRQALAPLAEAGWVIQRIVPEFCPAESESVSFHALQTLDEPQLVACLPDAVIGFPHAAWPAWDRHWQAGSRLMAEPAALTFARDLTGQEPQLQTAPQRWLKACQSPWDLAQGEWAQNRHRRTWRFGLQAWQQLRHAPTWQPVRWALGLMLVANLVGLQIWALQARQHTDALAEASRNILQQTFPGVQVVVDPLRQMQQAVHQLRQQSGASAPEDFEMLLARLAPLLPNELTPQALRYDGKTLTVQGAALDQVAPQALADLSRQGYQLRAQGNDWVLSWEGRP